MGIASLVGTVVGCSCGGVVGIIKANVLELPAEDGSRMIAELAWCGAGGMLGSTAGVISDAKMTCKNE